MAKDKKPLKNKESNYTADHYKLNTKAVDRLVNADKMEIPKEKLGSDPAKKYRSDFLDRIPDSVKALFIKFWFNGAVCYFIFWGLGVYVYDHLDMIIIMSVILGMINDILVNNILRFIESVPNANDKWMMFPRKKYWTFITNIIYSFVVLNGVVWLYEMINNVLKSFSPNAFLGVEPILFGVFYLLIDILLVSMKNLTKTIINDAKEKVNKE
jgi:hypothetical protein